MSDNQINGPHRIVHSSYPSIKKNYNVICVKFNKIYLKCTAGVSLVLIYACAWYGIFNAIFWKSHFNNSKIQTEWLWLGRSCVLLETFWLYFSQQSTLDRKKKNFSFSRKFPFMKSKDDKSEDGSDQERKYILHMYTHISLCFSYIYL